MENRAVATFAASSLQFNVIQDDAFTSDTVDLVNPDRGLYGFQQTKRSSRTSTTFRCRSRTA